jgi:hypothetical protein
MCGPDSVQSLWQQTPGSRDYPTKFNQALNFKGDGWLSWWRACLLRQLSGFESRHLSKTLNGQRSGQHTLPPPPQIYKKNYYNEPVIFSSSDSFNYLQLLMALVFIPVLTLT